MLRQLTRTKQARRSTSIVCDTVLLRFSIYIHQYYQTSGVYTLISRCGARLQHVIALSLPTFIAAYEDLLTQLTRTVRFPRLTINVLALLCILVCTRQRHQARARLQYNTRDSLFLPTRILPLEDEIGTCRYTHSRVQRCMHVVFLGAATQLELMALRSQHPFRVELL